MPKKNKRPDLGPNQPITLPTIQPRHIHYPSKQNKIPANTNHSGIKTSNQISIQKSGKIPITTQRIQSIKAKYHNSAIATEKSSHYLSGQSNKSLNIKLRKLPDPMKQTDLNQLVKRKNNSGELQEEKQQLQKLDQWSNEIESFQKKNNERINKSRRKKRRISESIAYLYKNENKYVHHSATSKSYQFHHQNFQQIGLFLTGIDTHIQKLFKINYQSIYKNIQYTQGVYEGEINILFKKISCYRAYIQDKIGEKKQQIKLKREDHNKMIGQLNKSRVTDYFYRYHTSQTKGLQQQAQRPIENSLLKPVINQQKENTGQNDSDVLDSCENQSSLQYIKSITSRNSVQPILLAAQLKVLKEQHKITEQDIRSSIETDRNSMNSQEKGPSFHMKSQKNIKQANLIQDINKVRKEIQDYEQDLKPLKQIQQQIATAKMKVLKTLLQTGFDTRDDGLAWVLRQLHKEQCRLNRDSFDEQVEGDDQIQKDIYQAKLCDFPSFLTNQEIEFIKDKFKNNFRFLTKTQKKEQKQDQKTIRNQPKQERDDQSSNTKIIQQAYRNITRIKNRKLSLIQQSQLLEKLLNEQRKKKIINHKYLTKDIINLIEGTQKIKATKYQIIYQQTLKKLSRLCTQQIYQTTKNSQSGPVQSYKRNQQNLKKYEEIINDLKKMISDSKNVRDDEQRIKTKEEKQLSEILKKLRNQRYQGTYSLSQKNSQFRQQRNQIRVICCLVGAKRAQKIVETEFNMNPVNLI